MVEVASSHDFPHFSEPPEAQLRQVLADQQAKFRSDLDFQVRTNNALREMSRVKERELENSQLEANREELRHMREAERARRDADKAALTTSWDQEVRMKGIWKAIENHTNAAAHSVPLKTAGPGLTPDFGDAGASRQNLQSSHSNVSARRTPTGASMSLAAQKEKLAREEKMRKAGKNAVGVM
jgi:hypothetical protein